MTRDELEERELVERAEWLEQKAAREAAERVLTTDEALAIIADALKRCILGTYEEGQRIETFLREHADRIHESMQDDMSIR